MSEILQKEVVIRAARWANRQLPLTSWSADPSASQLPFSTCVRANKYKTEVIKWLLTAQLQKRAPGKKDRLCSDRKMKEMLARGNETSYNSKVQH